MKAYSITYDLKSPNRNYSGLYDAIKATGKWWHYLESTWLVVTDETPQQIWTRLQPSVDNDDNLLIIEVKNNAQGWLPKEAWDWINVNITP
ncbi:hypothetical protein [Vibrio parahaemolyticus]|uniref:hypothetical protein n=1 Tax=Vibrio parahaemolyticus TaxID=670 RepID=UPI00226B3731|nr:hypothetical protein [Vibrio parahaemolyticus]MCX8819277.1 hypothetical protein [Vibrio parahaemolyticus]